MTTAKSALLVEVITQTPIDDDLTQKKALNVLTSILFFYHKYEFSQVFQQNQVRQVVIAQLFLHELLRGVRLRIKAKKN